MKKINESFNHKIYECDKHVEKLTDAKEYLKAIMPLSIENYLNIGGFDS